MSNVQQIPIIIIIIIINQLLIIRYKLYHNLSAKISPKNLCLINWVNFENCFGDHRKVLRKL